MMSKSKHNSGSSEARKMFSEFSSPSSSAGGTSTSTSPKEQKGPHFVVKREPPTHVFCGHEFEFGVGMVNVAKGESLNIAASISVTTVSEEDVNIRLLSKPKFVNNVATIRCNVSSQQLSHTHGVSVCLRVESPGCTSCTTRTVSLVNTRLVLSHPAMAPWDNIWYKDEGGRDRGIEIIASLCDRYQQIVKNVKVPLHLTLCYADDNPEPVSNQDILRPLKTIDRYKIDDITGYTTIRFRIEDVSKNHQGQKFCVKVEADAKKFKDVAPAYTPSVSVRSKRNKRSRAPGQPVGQVSERNPASPSILNESIAHRERKRIRLAVDEVSRWATEVVNSLAPLQWSVLGYEQFPDGTPDYSRPYHSMPNPNPVISRIMNSFTGSTREHLRVLHNSLSLSPSRSGMPGWFQQDDSFYHLPPVSSVVPEISTIASHAQQHRLSPPMIDRLEHNTRYQPPIDPQYEASKIRAGKASQSLSVNREEQDVEFVLAKQFKSIRTGDHLGFPAYSASKELIGFFRENGVGAGSFTPVSQYAEDFGAYERSQATEVLNQAITKKNPALHSRKEWPSLSRMIDHCIVYDFSSSMGNHDSAG